jgi:hypothetical protein
MYVLARLAFVVVLLALAPPAAGQSTLLDPVALLAQADTFTLQISGRAVGSQIVALDRVSGGFVFRETTTTPAGGQTTEVHMDSALAMKTVQQEGEMNGQAMRIDVRYSDARAVGTARVPGPEGMVDLVIDAAVPTGVVDDNVLMALLPALPWTDGATFRLPIFASGRNALVNYTFTVTGREQTEVAGEKLGAFRVEVEGPQPLVLHVSAVAPHRLLRLQVVGSPMELVRTGGNDL